jgi:2-C-methyl-D-erythritol 4-phosphate cytidylyltransferase
MGTGVKKEYLPLGTGTVLSSSVQIFSDTGLFSTILITIPAGGESAAKEALCSLDKTLLDTLLFTAGGASRQESVLQGLEALAASGFPKTGVVLIHDGARPWVSPEIIQSVAETAAQKGATVPCIPPVDTLKEIAPDGTIVRHLRRDILAAVQTPQGFHFGKLLEAHRAAQRSSSEDGAVYTDDTEIWDRYEGAVYCCPGSPENKKITYRDDIDR